MRHLSFFVARFGIPIILTGGTEVNRAKFMDTQPIAKVSEGLYLRHNAPGLHEMESFRIDFGLVWAANDNETLYMSAAGRLASRRHAHEWGIGRHLLDSQIFDYRRGSLGHIHEHWTDRDQLDVSIAAGMPPISGAQATHWGPDMPPSFG